MNDDELKSLWRQQPLREPNVPVTRLFCAMQKRTTQLRRFLDARDICELAACAFVIIVFGVFYFTVYREPVSRLGDLIVIGSMIFIAWKIVHVRRSTPPAPPGATIVESLRAELNSTRTQSRLLGSVLWWYILPGFVGVMVATWGLGINVPAKIFSTLIFIVVDVFIYWLNQEARSNQLLPLEEQLESLIHSAETGESLDEAQVASLRPIVLSMATDHVKPAEFRVRATSSAAFWRIALLGEIGFIGIWFFLMLDLTTRNWQRLIWIAPLIVPFFLAGLLYSWLLLKITELLGAKRSKVGISSLGIHLDKGQTLIVWDEIREVRPVRVLHVRNLWLIREARQKTIMPWSGLERHPELKAAIESFAPANHPIRKHLSLL